MRTVVPALAPLALPLLAGCWVTGTDVQWKIDHANYGGDNHHDSDDTGLVVTGDIDVSSIEPSYGTTAGGQTVVIHADPVDGDDVAVSFGGADADVVSVDGDAITVTTPAVADEGYVEIDITSGGKSAQVANGYHYWQDGAGLTGAIGEVGWYVYQGQYWDDPSSTGSAWLALVHPAAIHYYDYWGGSALDKCKLEGSFSGPSYDTYDFGLSEVALDGPSRITLTSDAGLFSTDLADGDFAWDDSWSLETDREDPWPAVSIDAFVATADDVQITQPYVDGVDTTDISFVSESIPLAWSGPYTGDYAVAELIRYEGSAVVDRVYCHLRDDGSFTVPSTVWSGWESDDQMTIIVGRVEVSNTIVPTNGAAVEVGGVSYAVGAAWTL